MRQTNKAEEREGFSPGRRVMDFFLACIGYGRRGTTPRGAAPRGQDESAERLIPESGVTSNEFEPNYGTLQHDRQRGQSQPNPDSTIPESGVTSNEYEPNNRTLQDDRQREQSQSNLESTIPENGVTSNEYEPNNGTLQHARQREQPQSNPESTIRNDLESLEKKIRNDIESLERCSTKIGERKTIILHHELLDFWRKENRDQFYKSQKWCTPEMTRNDSMRNYFKIMSILILIKFDNWNMFDVIFIKSQLSDEKLPFKREKLRSKDFLADYFGREFFDKQWMFCPMIIEESSVLQRCEPERRFPFIEKTEEIGSGSAGRVCKEVIAPHHIRYSTLSGSRPSENIEPKMVAVKRVMTNTSTTTQVEFNNLRSLRQTLSQHSRIMVNIATIYEEHSTYGGVYHIFYDLAAFTLETFLTDGTAAKRNESAPPRRNNSGDWWAGDMVQESQNLANALAFLHDRLYQDNVIACTHNDLKPENILVFFPNSNDESEKYPVGQWKITDFGISRIKQKREAVADLDPMLARSPSPERLAAPVQKRHTITESDVTHRQKRARAPSLSITTAKRDYGRFTAPEVRGRNQKRIDGRAGDVWSLGGILCETLAYAVRGCEGVHAFRRECEKPYDGEDMRFYDRQTHEFKKDLKIWLENLPSKLEPPKRESKWIEDYVVIILKMMVREEIDRINAESVVNGLQKIAKAMKPHKPAGFWLGDDSTDASVSRDPSRPGSRNYSRSSLTLTPTTSPGSSPPKHSDPPLIRVDTVEPSHS